MPNNLSSRIRHGRIKYGVGESDYFPGNVSHLVQPIVGMLRIVKQDGEYLDEEDVDFILDRLEFVLDLAQEQIDGK